VFSFAALEKAWKEATLQSEREHVTPYIWKNENLFKRMTYKNNEDLSSIRLTVDEEKDLDLVNAIIKKIGKTDFRLKDIIKVIRENPSFLKINKGIERNEGYQKSLKEDHFIKE
jgi:spore coat polysaccharide biosynthesis protein SpsF